MPGADRRSCTRFVTGPENGSEVYWVEQVMGAGLQKEEALQLFSSLSESYRSAILTPPLKWILRQNHRMIWTSGPNGRSQKQMAPIATCGYMQILMPCFEDMLQDPESKATFFQVVLIIGRE